MSGDSRLAGVHPDLVAAVGRILTRMAAGGFPMIVVSGVRTAAQQQALYAKGRTTPGAIVTHCDGVVKKSNHQPHADGWGHAVDCAFFVEGHARWDDDLPWAMYGAIAQDEGCVWGGSWAQFPDRPHLEWPEK